jgi:hypothetical protein
MATPLPVEPRPSILIERGYDAKHLIGMDRLLKEWQGNGSLPGVRLESGHVTAAAHRT